MGCGGQAKGPALLWTEEVTSCRAALQLEQGVKGEAGEGMAHSPEMPGPVLVHWCAGAVITNTCVLVFCPCRAFSHLPDFSPASLPAAQAWPFCGEEAGAVAASVSSGTAAAILSPPNPANPLSSPPLLSCLDLQCVRGLKDLLRTTALCLSRSGLGGARHPAPPPA